MDTDLLVEELAAVRAEPTRIDGKASMLLALSAAGMALMANRGRGHGRAGAALLVLLWAVRPHLATSGSSITPTAPPTACERSPPALTPARDTTNDVPAEPPGGDVRAWRSRERTSCPASPDPRTGGTPPPIRTRATVSKPTADRGSSSFRERGGRSSPARRDVRAGRRREWAPPVLVIGRSSRG